MKQVSLLLKPAGAHCNMACRYCFYHDLAIQRKNDSGYMSDALMRTVIRRSFEAVEEDGSVHYAFQGGEPTLAGLPFFEAFVQEVERQRTKQTIHYSLQTNGLLLADDWIQFLKKHDVLTGISIDGYEALHDSMRIDGQGKNTFWRVLDTYQRLCKAGVRVNVLCVIHSKTSEKASALYAFFKAHHMTHLQLIPCLEGEYDKKPISPQQFADFYTVFFQHWIKDWYKGEAPRVGLFDDLLLMGMDHLPLTCGRLGRCAFQNVIEADGTVYPCDFYALDGYACGNIESNSLTELRKHPHAKAFLTPSNASKTCNACRFYGFCRGGCPRKRSIYLEEATGICGFATLLERILPTILQEAAMLKQNERE